MIPRQAKYIPSTTLQALKAHLAKPNPCALHLGQQVTAHWPARTKWTMDDGLEAIRSGREDREVEVEVGKRGRGYLDIDYQRINIGLGLFLDAFILGRIPSKGDPNALPTAYLAQSDIDDKQLLSDVPELDLFQAGRQGTMYRRTLWIGPKQSFTPFHRDPYVGIYSQIIGTKTFHVLPPSASLDPSTDPRHSNTSTIPLPVSSFFPAYGEPKYPHDLPGKSLEKARGTLSKAFELQGACQVTLQPGESVLVPEGWWHSAEGGPTSGVGVGGWFR